MLCFTSLQHIVLENCSGKHQHSYMRTTVSNLFTAGNLTPHHLNFIPWHQHSSVFLIDRSPNLFKIHTQNCIPLLLSGREESWALLCVMYVNKRLLLCKIVFYLKIKYNWVQNTTECDAWAGIPEDTYSNNELIPNFPSGHLSFLWQQYFNYRILPYRVTCDLRTIG